MTKDLFRCNTNLVEEGEQKRPADRKLMRGKGLSALGLNSGKFCVM